MNSNTNTSIIIANIYIAGALVTSSLLAKFFLILLSMLHVFHYFQQANREIRRLERNMIIAELEFKNKMHQEHLKEMSKEYMNKKPKTEIKAMRKRKKK